MGNSKYKNYTDNDIIFAVKSSISKRQALKKLGLVPAGGNYKTITDAIERLNLDTSHFLGHGHNLGKVAVNRKPVSHYLVKGKRVSGGILQRKLVKSGLKDYVCESCKRTEWMNRKIALEIHHIDGDSKNNLLENLALLCPNCHAQTKNWRGRALNGKASGLKRRGSKEYAGSNPAAPTNHCIDCGNPISKLAQRCRFCSDINRRVKKRPSKKQLGKMIDTSGYANTGRYYGVSPTTIRRWLRNAD